MFVIPNIGSDLAKVVYRIPSFASHTRELKLVETDLQRQRQRWHDEASLEVIDERMSLPAAWKLQVDTEARFINAKKEALSKLTSEIIVAKWTNRNKSPQRLRRCRRMPVLLHL